MNDTSNINTVRPAEPLAEYGDDIVEIHKPKPVHNWREFLSEIGIIVIGVLIAMAAEQTIEAVHWHHRVETARKQMDNELHDSLMTAMELTKLHDCEITQVDALSAALAAGHRPEAAAILKRGSMYPPGRLWADDAWSATISAQISDHFAPETVLAYSQLYDMIRSMRRNQELEQALELKLAILPAKGVPNSPEITYQQMEAVTQLKLLLSASDLASDMIDYAKSKLGLTATEAQFEEPGHSGMANVAKCKADAAALAS